MQDLKFDLKDITIVPSIISDINSRSECDVYYEDLDIVKSLPLIAAPMDTVVGNKNLHHFLKNNITVCLPRGENYSGTDDNGKFLIEPLGNIFRSFGLDEVEEELKLFIRYNTLPTFIEFRYILIDIANGHMLRLINVVKKLKNTLPHIKIMVGNVAHPLTYKNLAMAGADYVRCSIGTGCFTPGQIIKLKDTKKNIEDIRLGDKVLTHKNKYQEVKNKFEYTIEEEIYKVNNISCTKKHEFYVVETQYKDIINDENIQEYAKWISAEELDKEKHLLIEY